MAVLYNIQAKMAAFGGTASALRGGAVSLAAVALVVWGARTASSSPPSTEIESGAPAAKKPPSPPTATVAPATDAASSGIARSAVLASFKGGQITVADMEAAIANKDPGTRARIAKPGGREDFLQQMVRHDLLVLEAERRGYGYHAAVIDAGKRAAIEQMIKRDLTVDPSSISQSDVAAHYQGNLEKYRRPLMRRASHIEVASEAEAKALIAELKATSRERFAKVAGERSHDERTRRQGGELGYFDRDGRIGGKRDPGAISVELVRAAFALKRPGDISARPVTRPSGSFSVLMLTGEMPGLEPKLAEFEGAIRGEIAEQRQQEAQQALLAKLQEQWKPEVHPERMDAIQLDVGAPLDQPQGFPAAPPDPRAPPRIVQPDGF